MGTNSRSSDGSAGWPWSALGIAQTAEKAAIHAAYAAKRAELDAQAMRISAFAELTEAREKALFLASEILRKQERAGAAGKAAIETERVPEPEPTKLESTPRAKPLPNKPVGPQQPEPEPELGRESPREHGDQYRPAADIISEAIEEALHPQANDATLEGKDHDEATEWEHAGRYAPDAEKELSAIFGGDPSSHHGREQHDPWSWGAPTPFLERYSINKYGVFWLAAILLLLALFGGF